MMTVHTNLYDLQCFVHISYFSSSSQPFEMEEPKVTIYKISQF